MAYLKLLCIMLVVIGRSMATTDPCEDSIELHSIAGRSPLSSATIPCDAYISPRWYKTPRYDMVTTYPGLNKCGSVFPIYLQGSLPNDTAIHNITACMVSPFGGCAETFIVRVKKCDEDRAYYLSPASACSSTYCFYASRNFTDVAPNWTPSSVTVIPDVDFDTVPILPTYYFTCSFTPETTEALLYKITWFVNSAKIKETGYLTESDMANSGRLTQIDLTTRDYKLNIMLSCGVIAVKSIQGEPGNYSHSADFYAGIRVLNRTISLQSGGNAYIYLKPTVPIPCPNYTDRFCNYGIWMFENYNAYKCKRQNIGSNQRCGVDMKGARGNETAWFNTRQWENAIPMLIKHRTETSFDRDRIYTLQLRVSNTLFNKILKGTVLDDVQVNIIPTEVQVWRENVCHGVADPHMRTFDGNHYEMHMAGAYLMYRHTTFNISIQAKTTTCGGVYCFCGIVINAGRDVFMIYVCPDYPVKFDRFMRCGDGLLKASSKGGSEYEVFLSTGTIVYVRIIASYLINVYIYPSVMDKGKTEGLCGSFDGNPSNDFRLRTGELQPGALNFHFPTPYFPYTYVNQFSSSWKLMESENLFPHANVVYKYNSLSPMPKSIQFCYCELNSAEQNVGKSIPEATCDYREYADCIDTRGRPLTCDHHRTKRSVHTMHKYFIQDANKNVIKVKKRSNTYSQAEAYDRCSQRFLESEIIQLCSGADLIDNSTLNLCVADLMITGNDSWITEQIESARLQCVHAVDFNITLQREMANITAAITSIACQNNCSGQGSCVNGTCICNNGYEETDCSVNKAHPPEIFGTSHQLVQGSTHKYSCDRSTENCQVIELYGQGFIYDPPPVMRIKKYGITTSYRGNLINTYTVSCTWKGKFEITCNLDTGSLPTDVFVTQYTYEISNDGVNFGSVMELHVFHATCQEVSHSAAGIIYKLKNNYCYIKDICHIHNAIDVSKSCSICNSTKEQFKWSTSNEGDCATISEKSNNALITGLSVFGTIIFLVVAVVVAVCIVKKTKCRHSIIACGNPKEDDNLRLFTRANSNLSLFSFQTAGPTNGRPTSANTIEFKFSESRPGLPTSNQSRPGLPASNEPRPGLPASNETSPSLPASNETRLGSPASNETSPSLPALNESRPGLPASNESSSSLPASNESRPGLPASNEIRPGLPAANEPIQASPYSNDVTLPVFTESKPDLQNSSESITTSSESDSNESDIIDRLIDRLET